LIHLAGGKISELFGPQFAGQDGFARQVRMPLPPMLLCDRVTGIQAEPGKLGTGTIWTESDVRADDWFLHAERMPVGITIEAGQADLLLISWMGIDAHNRSDRIYRLLGCEARVIGPLPKVGDTLKFDIHIDGHAQLGGIRMFFFHSDLRVNGELRLSVRSGQAGFFSDEELANSEGVLWDAASESPTAFRGKHGSPRIALAPRAFDRAAVSAFAAGRVRECFGPEFALTEAHTRTPRIQSGRMQLIEEVTHFDSAGGPWGRGYLRAVKTITPDLWFFEGHFKNDPCMPGTLMLEGAVQAMAFYLTALGCTVRADGWRFEPTQGENVLMRCRGQCTPRSRELVYEVFVEEFTDGPVPRLRASVMASVDGKKGFLCQNLSLDLVPDWPLDELLRSGEVALLPATKKAFTLDGFAFDHRSLLACALGRPSESFGSGYAALDGPVRIPRLPRPPYHFVTRIDDCFGKMGAGRAGMWVESDYAFAADTWYFGENGSRTMPAYVLMEAMLQPCGWLASFARAVAPDQGDVFFRNLDGKMDWTEELPAAAATLRMRVELTNWSALGTMIIVSFRVTARLGERRIAGMETSFGFFPADAFANQAGLVPTAREADYVARTGDFLLRLRGPQRDPWPLAGAELAGARLLMLDRLTGWWPQAGEAGLGILRGEKDVIASDWFFQAHFMQDPVQPGSLGIEALLQLLQAAMRLSGLGTDLPRARFEPVALGEPLEWKYRGQIVPSNQRITSLVEITRIERTETTVVAHARGTLFVDGKKVYELPRLAMRVRAGEDGNGDRATPPALGAASGISAAELSRMPRQHESLVALPDNLPPGAQDVELIAREHVGHEFTIHPTAVQLDSTCTQATSAHLPLQWIPLHSEVVGGRVRVASSGPARWLDAVGAGLFRGEFLADVSRALRQRYVRYFREQSPAATAAWRGRPVLICSNHQTALESMIFTDLYERWSGLPVTTVTRQEHRESWMGRLTEFMWNYPGRSGGVNPQLLFDRDHPSSFFEVMARYKANQAVQPHSLHLHVEGEQGLSCRQRVRRMSSVLVDVALDLNMAILPLKFSGGLPIEPLPGIISFPHGYGRQDFTFGAPLEPDLLRSMPRPKAAELVVDAINQIHPAAEVEQPLPAEPEFASRVQALAGLHRVTEIQAGLILALQELADPSPATRAMLAFPERGAAMFTGTGAELAWHAAVADWLWGRDSRITAESENWKRTAKH